jgi:hypothetical protein
MHTKPCITRRRRPRGRYRPALFMDPVSVQRRNSIATAADLKPVHAGSSFVKFADDTYLVITADCVDSRSIELDNIEAWATENYLKLNKLKHARRKSSSITPPAFPRPAPPPLPDVACDITLKTLDRCHLQQQPVGVRLRSLRRVVSDSAKSLYTRCEIHACTA